MLANLLAERFQLTVHREKREVPVYDLVVAKGGPKCKKSTGQALPNPDAGWTTGKDGFPAAHGPLPKGVIMPGANGRARIQANDETMQDLADRLSALVGTRVTDATGLRAKYDDSLTFDLAVIRSLGPSPAPGGSSPLGATPDSDMGMPIASEIQSQLGLKLEKRKGSVEMVVIDHVATVPIEN
jgi:uncharacterized protein (TIGR03435 family)